MRAFGLQTTAVTYTTLMNAAVSLGNTNKSVELYTQGSNLLTPTIRSNPQRLDLHGASLAVSKAAIFFHRNQQTLPNIIVVGKGNHSETDPSLREGIPIFLSELSIQHEFDSHNNGRIILH